MAKYSTGGVGSGPSGACELCGAEGRSLETTTVAGAELDVCSECRKHGEGSKQGSSSNPEGQRSEQTRRRKAARNAARMDDARSVDTDFESGTDYEDDPLPYLVDGYGAALEEARQAAGLRIDELAADLGVEEDDIVAVEQGRAARANVGGSLVEALEEALDVDLAE